MKKPCITFKNVTKTFDMRLLYKKISFELQFSDIVLLTGNNGAGKSTLLRMAADLCPPTHGEITCHVDVRDRAYLGHATFIYPQLTAYENLEFWTKATGFVSQKEHILDSNISNDNHNITEKNILEDMHPQKTNRNPEEKQHSSLSNFNLEAQIMQVLKQVNLEKFAHDPAGIFSRGMSQRLNIARIILQNPRFLLLDEPCTGLDTESKEIFYTCIKNFTKKEACILWVSHDAKVDSLYANHHMHIEKQSITLNPIQNTQHNGNNSKELV